MTNDYCLTRRQAQLIVDAHEITSMDEEEWDLLEAQNPELADAYRALRRVAFGADTTARGEQE